MHINVGRLDSQTDYLKDNGVKTFFELYEHTTFHFHENV